MALAILRPVPARHVQKQSPSPQRQSIRSLQQRNWRLATGVSHRIEFKDAPRRILIWDEHGCEYHMSHSIEPAELYTSSGDDSNKAGVIRLQSFIRDASQTHMQSKRPSLRHHECANAQASTQLHSEEVTGATIGRNVSGCSYLLPASAITDDYLPLSASRRSQTPRPPAILRSVRKSSTIDTMSSTERPPGEVWHDDTRDFSMTIVRTTVRDLDERPGELVRNYNWYPDAVPVDSLLPPGVPMSSTEICAYYPHHVRWQEVMVRLAQNDYRGLDILGVQVSNAVGLSRVY